MKLPIPGKIGDGLYTDCEIVKPSVNSIAATHKMAEDGNLFSAMRPFCSDCITSFTTADGKIIEDIVAIKSIIPKLPYKTIEYIAVQAVLKHYGEDDGVEGVYPCPRCDTKFISEYREDDGIVIDTQDHISQLQVHYFDPGNDSFIIHVDLTEPIQIKDREGDVLEEITSLDVSIPTLENCIIAESKVGFTDKPRLQIAIYVESLKKVNDKEIDNKFRNSFGMLVFGKIREIRKDLGGLSRGINRFGLDTAVEKTCRNCGKVWKAHINTSNFFVGTPLSF